jgi:SAM-dependent methyltransferase
MGWRSKALRAYQWLEKRIAPELHPSYFDYAEVLLHYVYTGVIWLEAGCGHQILPPVCSKVESELASRAQLLIGIDYERSSLLRHQTIVNRVRGDIGRLPFRDNSFDVVTANWVVEHLDDPARQFAEIERVLKPGGVFIFHTPNLLSPMILISHITPNRIKKRILPLIFGWVEEDIFPTMYRANTARSIGKIAGEVGLKVEEIRMVASCGHYHLIFFPPGAILEMLWLKAIKRCHILRHFRRNIVVVLRKPPSEDTVNGKT